MTTTSTKTAYPPVPSRHTLFERLGQAVALMRRYGRVVRVGAALLWQHNVTAMSAALSFRTIFAMIPVLVLAFLVLKSIGVLENSKEALRSVLEASGFSQIALVQASDTAPADADSAAPADEQVINLADELERLVARVEKKLTVGRLGPVGIVLLIYTATTLLTAMERSLNRIFNEPRGRSLTRRVPLYWSVMTLGPVLVVVASYLSQRAAGVLGNVGGIAWLLTATGEWGAPFLSFLLLFFGLYKLLPNVEVRWAAALSGALFAAPAWLIAKWLFAIYMREIVATGNLYGALGLVPIFLVWLNLSWLIFLYGAELAYVSGNLASLQSAIEVEPLATGPRDLLAVMLAIARSYDTGQGPVSLEVIKDKVRLPDGPVHWLVERLVSVGAVCAVGTDDTRAYVPARPPDKIPVIEVLQLVQPNGALDARGIDPEVEAMLSRFQQRSRAALGETTIGDLVETNPHNDEPR